MVLMEDVVDTPSQSHKRKSITINTKTQPPSATNSPIVKARKSILKKSDKRPNDDSTNNGDIQINSNEEELSNMISQESSTSIPLRPHTLEELVLKEALNVENISSTFNLEDISDNEDIWIMDLPRSIDSQELCGQVITLEDKSKFRIKNERYCIVAHKMDHHITCVLNTKTKTSEYKTVNIKPTGSLTMRKKLSGTPEMKPMPVEKSGMQFPDNLKTRHPLLGVVRERKRKSKKRSSFKNCKSGI
ncbi:uncharacterized protein [Linepithema humile]|nr:PREDICTED: uncharacterized protein LOC105679647 isoform X2 [Linepithema humile]